MTDPHHRRLDRRFASIERRMPQWLGRPIGRLRKPSATWVRVPVGILFVIGGLLSFLPILGLWMLPVGLALLAYDVPFLKRPISRALVRLERWWVSLRRRQRNGQS